MLVITCPYCGPRNSNEFSFGGELTTRPGPDPDPAAWRRYLYMKNNVAGWQREQWFHVSGCRRFLIIERHTVSNEVRSVRDVAGTKR
jgi:heterotetrameric sarcosine oxidase delta subunit